MQPLCFNLTRDGKLVQMDCPRTRTRNSTRPQTGRKSRFSPKPAPSSNPRRKNLDAAYGVVARLQEDPNQPELILTLQRYLNELRDGLQGLEADHEEMQREFVDLQRQIVQLEDEVQRSRMIKITASRVY